MSSNDQYYRRNLPHYHPEGFSLFITYRLANPLPEEVLSDLKQQRVQDLERLQTSSLAERYNVEKKHFSHYDDWLDRCVSGLCWLEKTNVANIVIEKIQSLAGERYKLFTYCIMPNHVHLLIKYIDEGHLGHHGKTAKYPVTDTLRLLKGSTARYCNQALGRDGEFWQHESYDHYVRDEEELGRTIHYILNNPVKAGLVDDWKKWPFTYVNPELGEW
jgi:REP element-mobilizing transposase RayT